MRVLAISPFPALPPTHGGRVRTYRLSAGLAAAGARVDLLAPWAPGLPLRRFVRDRVCLHPHLFLANALPALADGRVSPLVALSWQPFVLGPRRRLTAIGTPDVLQVHFCAHARWMERLAGRAKLVYVAHNVEQDYLRMQPDQPWASDAMLRRLADLERRAVRASDLVIACSEHDAVRLADLYDRAARVEVIPQGLDDSLLEMDRPSLRSEARRDLDIGPDTTALLFIGGPARRNRDAADFLERELLPRLGERFRLLIAGKCARKGGSPERVSRLGYVKDLRPIFAAADVGLNPVTYGSGADHKVAQYLSAGLPTVTTPVGARGYERLRERLDLATREAFPAAIEHAARPRPLECPPTQLSWSSLGRRLHVLYDELVGG
jgi:glycosyltransferase involved in cell wall biosynthesis